MSLFSSSSSSSSSSFERFLLFFFGFCDLSDFHFIFKRKILSFVVTARSGLLLCMNTIMNIDMDSFFLFSTFAFFSFLKSQIGRWTSRSLSCCADTDPNGDITQSLLVIDLCI